MNKDISERDLIIEDMLEVAEDYCCEHTMSEACKNEKSCGLCQIKALVDAGFRRTKKAEAKKKSLKDLINDRLLISLRKFEKEVGLSRQTIYSIMHDNHKPTELTTKIICDYFEVDYKEYL